MDAGRAWTRLRIEDAAVPAAGVRQGLSRAQSARHDTLDDRRRYEDDRVVRHLSLSRREIRADAVDGWARGAGYGAFLNWMYFSDATLTFPQTLVLRYSQLEPEERRNPQVATDYAKWFLGRLRAVEAATAGRETLCAGRFTAADIVVGYALRLADTIGLSGDFGPNVAAYWARLRKRDGYKQAVAAERRAGTE